MRSTSTTTSTTWMPLAALGGRRKRRRKRNILPLQFTYLTIIQRGSRGTRTPCVGGVTWRCRHTTTVIQIYIRFVFTWFCHFRYFFQLCLDQGELEYCGMGQNYCQIEERQRAGHIYQLKSGCKQPQACMINWATNFRNESYPECDPGSMHYSVCRQCCGGDNADCNFQRFNDPDQRFTVCLYSHVHFAKLTSSVLIKLI